MNEWASKEEYEKNIKELKFEKELKDLEAMLVLQWYRMDYFDLENTCNADEACESCFNIIYNSSVDIIIYTKEQKYFIRSAIFGDSKLSLRKDWEDTQLNLINYNHIYARELLQKLAPHKLEYFFKERISGFLQIPVRVSLSLAKPKEHYYYDGELWLSKDQRWSHYIMGYEEAGENLGKEIDESTPYAYIKDIQKLGQAIEFDELNEKDIVLEDKFNFAPRFKKSKPYNVKATRMYKEHEPRYKHKDFATHKVMPKNDKDLWIDLMSNTKKIRSKKPINLKDLRPDYVKFKGLWATTRYVFNFDF
ncbi:hypothetical protein, partial [Campylobacter troglodytis]|uniref:hypothetical protein n=1 Tax=Campylobacter troglodytis TaxID=654363 RepID=UPI00115BFD56